MWFLSVISHLMTKNLDKDGLRSIVENYDLFFIDLWGVVHNGINLHKKAIETLVEISKSKKCVILKDSLHRVTLSAPEKIYQMGH